MNEMSLAECFELEPEKQRALLRELGHGRCIEMQDFLQQILEQERKRGEHKQKNMQRMLELQKEMTDQKMKECEELKEKIWQQQQELNKLKQIICSFNGSQLSTGCGSGCDVLLVCQECWSEYDEDDDDLYSCVNCSKYLCDSCCKVDNEQKYCRACESEIEADDSEDTFDKE